MTYIYIYILSLIAICSPHFKKIPKNIGSPYPVGQRVPTGQCLAHPDKVQQAGTMTGRPKQCLVGESKGI
jgi:hypothetical protein